MKGQLKVSTPEEYIARFEEPRKSEVAALDALIRKTAPKLAPFIMSGMLGYGPKHYKYASGREGDTAQIALASNESYISLYVGGTNECGSIIARYKDELPKAKVGKSCVRFKRLDDLNPAALKNLIRESARMASA